MADKIKLLPEIVANQIAAGEVVQDPSSVVKEMMENSLDAGATRIDVEYRNGGLEYLTIVDNGCGMSPVDARMAFDRHATSKIATVEDIYALRTFGFRGEALASIAAVSEVTLRTRQQGDELGTQTEFKGGEYVSQVSVLTPVGSNFRVVNLLYNVPARRKFLPEQINRLGAAIRTEFNRIALCNPGVEMHLVENEKKTSGRNSLSLQPSSLAGRIVDVVGQHIKKNLLEVGADTSIVKIKGFVGRPAVAKKRNNERYLFVNGRFFESTYMSKAILKAYEKLIPAEYFPSYFIYIEVDPERVDVNVSPKKTEVKFSDTDYIWQILNAAVRETLAKTGAVPLMDFDSESNVEIPVSERGAVYAEPKVAANEMYNPFLVADDGTVQEGGSFTAAATASRRKSAGAATGAARAGGVSAIAPDGSFDPAAGMDMQNAFAGSADEDFDDFESSMGHEEEYGTELELGMDEQPKFASVTYVGGGYAAALYGGRFVVADMRRAAERILYEQYLLLLGNNSSTSQKLLFPEKIILSNEEYELLENNLERFALLGFDLKPEGGGAVSICGVPAETDDEAVEKLILELLQTFDMPLETEKVRNEKLAEAMARSNAGRTVRNMTDEQAAQLLERLSMCDNTAFSPSGKAIAAVITPEEIRRKLG